MIAIFNPNVYKIILKSKAPNIIVNDEILLSGSVINKIHYLREKMEKNINNFEYLVNKKSFFLI